MNVQDIANAYQVTRQNLHLLRTSLGIGNKGFLDPDLVFQRLLSERRSALRTRLADPETRKAIKSKLNQP